MTIAEYLDAVTAALDLPEKVVARVRKELENELYEFVEAGASQQEAVEKAGPVAEVAARLNEKYADTRPAEGESSRKEMPLLLPWCLLFAITLTAVKGVQTLFFGGSALDAALTAAGLVMLIVCIAQMRRYKKKK